jgi:hypothetical protein
MSIKSHLKSAFSKAGRGVTSARKKSDENLPLGSFAIGSLLFGHGVASLVGVPVGGILAVGFVAALPAVGIMAATGLATSFTVAQLRKSSRRAKEARKAAEPKTESPQPKP